MGRGSFGLAELGDRRRSERLVKVASAFAAGACCGGGGTITSVIPDTHQAKAAYRLLDNQAVTHESVLSGHLRHTMELLGGGDGGGGVELLIQDTTAVEYQGLEQAKGLGPIGEDFTRGFWLHSTLAVRWDEEADRCTLLGLVDQQAWARPRRVGTQKRKKSKGRGKESNHARQSRKERESRRWAAVLHRLVPPPLTLEQVNGQYGGVERIYVADRESDIYEVLQRCLESQTHHVIRAAYPRALTQDSLSLEDALSNPDRSGSDDSSQADGEAEVEVFDHREVLNLFQAVAQAPLRGVIQVELPREGRTAELEVRGVTVLLRGPMRPGGRLADMQVNVVQAREINPPAGTEALSWILLTDLAVDTLPQCLRVVRIYRCRWIIEEFHKALKTGLKLEQSQLSDYRRLSALAGIVSVVAVFLVQTKWEARTGGEEELDPATRAGTAASVLERLYPPTGKATRRWFFVAIARLGGFMARKSDGDPGWLTLWRGWQTLQILIRGYQLNSV